MNINRKRLNYDMDFQAIMAGYRFLVVDLSCARGN